MGWGKKFTTAARITIIWYYAARIPDNQTTYRSGKRHNYPSDGATLSRIGAAIAILNDSTRYQAEPGNADPEALPRLSPARQSKSDIDSQAFRLGTSY